MEQSIYVGDCPNLETVSGLEGLREIGGGLALEALPALTGVEALGGLRSAAGFGASSVGLTSLAGLERLGAAPGIGLWSNPDLTSLDGLAPRAEWGEFNVQGTPLEDLSALKGATRLESLTLWDAEVPDLADLSSLTRVDGDLNVRLHTVSDLHGLDALASVGGEVLLRTGATSLEGLGSLVTVGSMYIVEGNLLDISPLALETVEGDFGIGSCPVLESLDGLQSVTTVHGSLGLGPLDALGSLDGLEGLRRVDGLVVIDDNPSLTSVSGLSSIESIGGDLYITDNPSLSTADAEALVDAIGRENIGGEVYISGNGP